MTVSRVFPFVWISALMDVDDSQKNCDKVDHSDHSVAVHEEMNQGSQTAFRRWTAPSEGSNSQDAPVPGLREALTNAGLSSFCISIEDWCRKNGAAFLSEVADEVESICSDLAPPGSESLAPELRKRLFRALSSPAASELKRSSTTQGTIESVVANIREKMLVGRTAVCDRTFPGECDGQRKGLVPGLRNAFEQAGLSHLSDTAEVWCHDNGAAYLQEMLDYFDDLCENLNPPGSECLDPHVCESLKRTLSWQLAVDSGKLLRGNIGSKAKTW